MDKDSLYTQFDAVFFEKSRLSIITILFQDDTVSFNRLKKITGGSDGQVYGHLQKLLDAGYIAQKKEIADNRANTFYHLTKKGRETFRGYLKIIEKTISENKS